MDCSSPLDCVIGYFFPPVEAALAANNSGQGLACALLQCIFYPLLLPLMRHNVREQRGIDVGIIIYTFKGQINH